MTAGEKSNFEVFVTDLCHGSICDSNFNVTLEQIKDVIDQIFYGLEQLLNAKQTHNDLKPTNILYLKTGGRYNIKISDFGQAGKRGGTPGFTAPVFHRERQPGREDIFSAGWICLRLLCVSKELFLSLRDNYVDNINEPWMTDFRNLVEIKFISKLIDLDAQPTVQEVKDDWFKIRSSIRMIDNTRLQTVGVPSIYLKLQLERPRLVQFTRQLKFSAY